MFTVVNERLQQRFVQGISLQATNDITFYNTEWAKKTGPCFKVSTHVYDDTRKAIHVSKCSAHYLE